MTRLGGLVLVALCAASFTADAAPSTRRSTSSVATQEKTKKSIKKKKKKKKRSRTTASKKSRKKSSKRSRTAERSQTKRDRSWRNDPVNRRIERPADGDRSPAHRYGLMAREDCEAELKKRRVPFVREADTRGVRAPVRLTGPLHGVTYRTRQSDEERKTTIWEIADCRLVLALDDFARILAAHDVVTVVHYSMYRKPEDSHPDGKDGIRHSGALALDAGKFIKRDGTVLDVDDDWNGRLGAKTCGDGAGPQPATDKAKELRAILCAAVDQRIFNSYLTPNYDKPHKNHFHLEVTAGWKSFLVY